MFKAIVATAAVLVCLTGYQAPAEAFFTNKRDVCAKSAARGFYGTEKEQRKVWRQLGLPQDLFEGASVITRNRISNACDFYK